MNENYEIAPVLEQEPKQTKLTAAEARKKVTQLEKAIKSLEQEIYYLKESKRELTTAYDKLVIRANKAVKDAIEAKKHIQMLANAFTGLLATLDIQIDLQRNYIKLILEKETENEKS
ncbi:MAG TPA: hypothetical protein GX690_03755 [Tenericutes bacterium]|nr:hypothetical protein [Mycoplasmatota bacterium]